MRISGYSEDEDGNGRYLVEWGDTAGRKLSVLYSEAGGSVESVSAEQRRELFENGDLEACSFPASEVLFPDEVQQLAERCHIVTEEEKE